MGSARTVTAGDLRTRINHELRNTYQVQFTESELLTYTNKWLEFIHNYLIESGSELVRTGTGTITTSSGVERYLLSDNSMGDLLLPYKIWVSGSCPMEICAESDRDEYVMQDETDGSGYEEPLYYYIEGNYVGLLPFPDDTYTINLKYFPEYKTISAMTSTMPYRNLFNLQIEEGAKILAKNRENYGTSVDAALMDLFKDRAKSLVDLRQKRVECLSPMMGGYNG